eukprot:4769989-Pleurochrysis_carterae.AAC.1
MAARVHIRAQTHFDALARARTHGALRAVSLSASAGRSSLLPPRRCPRHASALARAARYFDVEATPPLAASPH